MSDAPGKATADAPGKEASHRGVGLHGRREVRTQCLSTIGTARTKRGSAEGAEARTFETVSFAACDSACDGTRDRAHAREHGKGFEVEGRELGAGFGDTTMVRGFQHVLIIGREV